MEMNDADQKNEYMFYKLVHILVFFPKIKFDI